MRVRCLGSGQPYWETRQQPWTGVGGAGIAREDRQVPGGSVLECTEEGSALLQRREGSPDGPLAVLYTRVFDALVKALRHHREHHSRTPTKCQALLWGPSVKGTNPHQGDREVLVQFRTILAVPAQPLL